MTMACLRCMRVTVVFPVLEAQLRGPVPFGKKVSRSHHEKENKIINEVE